MHYLSKLAVFTTLIFPLIGSINWFVDPYGYFWSPVIENVNARKTQADGKVRDVLPFRALAIKPNQLIIGNSRVQLGFNTENSAYFNLGIPGSPLEESLGLAYEQITNNNQLSTVYIALDYRYFLFPHDEHPAPFSDDYLEERMLRTTENTIDKIARIYPSLFSLDSLNSSIATLTSQAAITNSITQSGFNTGGFYVDAVTSEGKSLFFKSQLSALKQKFMRTDRQYEKNGESFSRALLHLFLSKIEQFDNVEVTFFLNPYHYSYWHIIGESNHWESFLNWKRDLAQLADNYPQFRFYDFSLPSKVTKEDPELEKNKALMQWFYEPAHYRPAVGNEILKAITGPQNSQKVRFQTLSKDTIEEIIRDSERGKNETQPDWITLKQQINLPN